jgi:uncharacterized membrane protein (UPF0127 family)
MRSAFLRLLPLVIFLVLFTNCKEDKVTKTSEQVIINFKKEGHLKLFKADNDSLIKSIDIEIADTDYETQTGLMYRTELKDNQGMLFIFPDEDYRSFYMKNTKIPLDIIYIGKHKKIVSIQKNAQPFNESSLPSEAPAKYVLEVYAGLSEKWKLEVGDKMNYSKL